MLSASQAMCLLWVSLIFFIPESPVHFITRRKYAEAREAFNRKTGLTLSCETYTSVMALDYKKLQVEATTLAKALCEFLAHVARKHTQYNKTDRIASVAHSLGGNQGRSIIPADVGTLPSERAPS